MHFLKLCVHLIDTVEIFNQLHYNGAIGEGEQLGALHESKNESKKAFSERPAMNNGGTYDLVLIFEALFAPLLLSRHLRFFIINFFSFCDFFCVSVDCCFPRRCLVCHHPD